MPVCLVSTATVRGVGGTKLLFLDCYCLRQAGDAQAHEGHPACRLTSKPWKFRRHLCANTLSQAEGRFYVSPTILR